MPPSTRRQCGAMAAHFRLLETDRGFRGRQSRLERATQRLAHAPGRRRTPIRIAVVVHVVWHAAAENLSQRQIAEQIAALNRDFRARSRDRKQVPAVWQGLVADAGIEFGSQPAIPMAGPATESRARRPPARPSEPATRSSRPRPAARTPGRAIAT